MQKLSYLTVPDFLWISQELTRKAPKYNFATLEEAVFSQYSYGSSTDLAGQAARLVKDFRRLHPFDAGNDAIAFVGLVAFLELNHQSLDVSSEEAGEWVRGIWADSGEAAADIESRMSEAHAHGVHGMGSAKEAVAKVFLKYSDTIRTLLDQEAAQPLA